MSVANVPVNHAVLMNLPMTSGQSLGLGISALDSVSRK
jgi:hypothetical protein